MTFLKQVNIIPQNLNINLKFLGFFGLHSGVVWAGAALSRGPAGAEHIRGFAVHAVGRVDYQFAVFALIHSGRAKAFVKLLYVLRQIFFGF